MFSKSPPLPPGCSSPPAPNSHAPSQWPIPLPETLASHSCGPIMSTRGNIEQITASVASGNNSNAPSSIVPCDNIKPYHNTMHPSTGDSDGDHTSSRGCTTTSSSTHHHHQTSPILCAGCKLRIMDKFVLEVVDAKWHSTCLKCVECGVVLENHMSCFERDSQYFCKDDYVR